MHNIRIAQLFSVPHVDRSLERQDHAQALCGFQWRTCCDPTLGHVRTNRRRVVDHAGHLLRRVHLPGWAETGARGVIAATMTDVYAVVDAIISGYFDN